ncbi:MAG TPA: hypothetical protein ENK19_01720, partial [Acidobacteria bacterium]|nr:hypothetical protein [Acidobacteriota bacterium]
MALAEALQSVPRELLLAESRLWEQVTGKKIGSKRQAEVARTIARWAFDRGLLERLLDRLEPECRLLVDLVPRAWPNLHMFLAGAAGEGHGDLLPHVPRCAALGLVVPIVRPGFSYDLWDRRQIRNPVAAHDLLVPETVFERSVSVPPVLVDVRRASRGEVLQSIPVERVLAAAAATAAAVMAAPLPLTRKGTISQRAVKRIARAAGADDRLPLGFQLAVLHHLGMLLRPRQGESARLVVEPSRLERMVTDGEALRQALLALGTGDLLGWELETGATVPESDDGFFGHYREVVATPRVRGYRAVLVHGLSAVPRSGGWIPVAELAMRLAERAPDWLVGRERWSWRREGESRWYVEPEDRRHLAALAVLHLAQTSVRLGVLELGASGSGAPQEVPIFPTCTPSIYGGGGELDDEVLAMAKGLVVRFVPPLPGLLGDSLPAATREAAPTLGSDLELQVPRGGLEYELAVLAALLGEPLPYTPGDRVLRSRITAASIVRARSIGVPVERIEGFLDLCRPAPAPAVRRRVLEWAGRAGSVTLHSGWSLAEWKSLQERDRALEVWPELRP